MNRSASKAVLAQLLAPAGVELEGTRPWDLRVHNPAFYERVIEGGTTAAGESYMDGWWDVERLDEFFERVFRARIDERFAKDFRALARDLYARLVNRQTQSKARRVAQTHYNLDNALFRLMLGKRMSYTCAYWHGAATLDEADEAKLELICRKLELKPGMSILEYGCGWGAFARYAAEKHGCRVVGVNIAEEQVKLGRELCAGLPVELRVQDYREVQGTFDRVVSVGIMEHIGPKNYRTYMECVARCLAQDGIAFIHTIGQNETRYRCDPWFDKHIFPNGVTPSLRAMSAAAEGLFVVEDCHNIGPHYDPTLMAWHENLSRAQAQVVRTHGERFFRMMRYYLLTSAATFRSRRSQVFQLVLTKAGRRQPKLR